MPSVWLMVVIALVVALAASWVLKRVPFVGVIGEIALWLWLISVYLANFSIQQPAKWVSSVPYFGYLLAIPGGLALGNLLKRWMPF